MFSSKTKKKNKESGCGNALQPNGCKNRVLLAADNGVSAETDGQTLNLAYDSPTVNLVNLNKHAKKEGVGKPSKAKSKRFFTTQNIVKLSVFTALSYILYMFLKVPIPAIFPSWLEFQISDLPALMAGFMIGPIGGAVVVVLKCLLKMPFTHTACVGEVADIVIGLAFVIPAALIYKRRRTKKGALSGIVIGSLCCVATAILTNAFVLIPFYVLFSFGGNEQILVDGLSLLFPSITWQTFQLYYLPLSVLPFNLLRCALSGSITFLLYKRTEKLFAALTPAAKRELY